MHDKEDYIYTAEQDLQATSPTKPVVTLIDRYTPGHHPDAAPLSLNLENLPLHPASPFQPAGCRHYAG